MADAINVTDDQALVAATVGAYRRAGVEVPVIFPLTWGAAGPDALEVTRGRRQDYAPGRHSRSPR